MNLWLRLLAMLTQALRAPRLDPLGSSVLKLRVYPNDLDLNLHMNNGRFLTVMDLGRLDLVIRTGMLQAVFRNRWRPVVAALSMRFRRSLSPFQRYELETRLVGWDESWFYLEQTFLSRGEVAARGCLKTAFLGKNGKVPPREVVEGALSPPLPDWTARL